MRFSEFIYIIEWNGGNDDNFCSVVLSMRLTSVNSTEKSLRTYFIDKTSGLQKIIPLIFKCKVSVKL